AGYRRRAEPAAENPRQIVLVVMFPLYPYQLKVREAAEGHRNEDGDWIPGTGDGDFVDYCPCRDEANTGGRMVPALDGVNYLYNRLIQTPVGTEPLPSEKLVQVWDGTELRFEGKV